MIGGNVNKNNNQETVNFNKNGVKTKLSFVKNNISMKNKSLELKK
jgi:hypothetical protein